MTVGTRDLVAAASAAGVRRFVLMSALGTTEETKELVPYYRSKWEMEQTVQASGLEHVILRPSFVFGEDGGALAQFRKIAKLAPVTPIVGPGTQQIQPIWVEDVAAYFAASIDKAEAANRTFELGGPGRRQLERVLGSVEGEPRHEAPFHPPSVRVDAAPGRGARAAAEPARHARPGEDAPGRRQRRHERRRRRDVQASARPARRAAPPRGLSPSRETNRGPLQGPRDR